MTEKKNNNNQPERTLSSEAKVGGLVVATMLIAALFAWLLGAKNPFRSTVDFYVTYNFAGGIDVGSPVRVAGIKVGKVERIEFFDPDKGGVNFAGNDTNARPDQIITPLKITVSVNKDAARSVRHDSQFFINIAGIIGERYIEIIPGTNGSPKLASGDLVRGVDPPRIDQLISQSFDLAGKIKSVIENNEGDITKSIKLIYDLSGNINKAVEQLDKSKILQTNMRELIQNMIDITSDVKAMSAKVKGKEGQDTLDLMYRLLKRLEPLDKEAITKFFQKEGIRTKLF